MWSGLARQYLDRADSFERLPEERSDEDKEVEDDESDADDHPGVGTRASDDVEAEEDDLLQQQAEDDEVNGRRVDVFVDFWTLKVEYTWSV